MIYLKTPIRFHALSAFPICLTLSSCVSVWDWKPNPYVGDHLTQSIVDKNGKVILASEKAFSEMTCFDRNDIESLTQNIERVRRKEKELKQALRKRINKPQDVLCNSDDYLLDP